MSERTLKFIWLALGLVLVVLLFTSCASPYEAPPGPRPDGVLLWEQPTDHGTFLCIYRAGGHGGGLSCWPLKELSR